MVLRKRRRRFALPAQSKTVFGGTSDLRNQRVILDYDGRAKGAKDRPATSLVLGIPEFKLKIGPAPIPGKKSG